MGLLFECVILIYTDRKAECLLVATCCGGRVRVTSDNLDDIKLISNIQEDHGYKCGCSVTSVVQAVTLPSSIPQINVQ